MNIKDYDFGFLKEGSSKTFIALKSSASNAYIDIDTWHDWSIHSCPGNPYGHLKLNVNNRLAAGEFESLSSAMASIITDHSVPSKLVEYFALPENHSELQRAALFKEVSPEDILDKWNSEPNSCRNDVVEMLNSGYCDFLSPGILTPSLYEGVCIKPYSVWEHSDFGYKLGVPESKSCGAIYGIVYTTNDDAERIGWRWSLSAAEKVIASEFDEAAHIAHGDVFYLDVSRYDESTGQWHKDDQGIDTVGDFYGENCKLAKEVYGNSFEPLDFNSPLKYSAEDQKKILSAFYSLEKDREQPHEIMDAAFRSNANDMKSFINTYMKNLGCTDEGSTKAVLAGIYRDGISPAATLSKEPPHPLYSIARGEDDISR